MPFSLPGSGARRGSSSNGRHHLAPPPTLTGATSTPTPASNQPLVSPSTSPTSFPARNPGDLAGFWPEPPPPWPKDPIASPSFFLGSFMQTRGLVVNLKNFPGPYSKVEFLNSKWLLLNLWKFVENHRKFRKLQFQFVGFPVTNPATFTKHCHTFSW
jgi:hypothetical protein